MMKPMLLMIAMALACPLAQAKVYVCTVNGEVIYTSKAGGHCQPASLQPIGSYSSTKPAYRSSSPARAPRVSARPRDAAPVPRPAATAAAVNVGNNQGRRQILEQELANERQALAQAQKALTEGRTMQPGEKGHYSQYQNRVRQLESAVLDRQQNVQALQRELGRM